MKKIPGLPVFETYENGSHETQCECHETSSQYFALKSWSRKHFTTKRKVSQLSKTHITSICAIFQCHSSNNEHRFVAQVLWPCHVWSWGNKRRIFFYGGNNIFTSSPGSRGWRDFVVVENKFTVPMTPLTSLLTHSFIVELWVVYGDIKPVLGSDYGASRIIPRQIWFLQGMI